MGRMTSRNTDKKLRALERAAAGGDPQAAMQIHVERRRTYLPLLPDRTSRTTRRHYENFVFSNGRGATVFSGLVSDMTAEDVYDLGMAIPEPWVPGRDQNVGAHGWPLVPSQRFPGERDLICPACGSARVTLGSSPGGRGSGPRGRWRMGDPGGAAYAECGNCRHRSDQSVLLVAPAVAWVSMGDASGAAPLGMSRTWPPVAIPPELVGRAHLDPRIQATIVSIFDMPQWPPITKNTGNSDVGLRSIERIARETQAPSDMAALISARVRAGMISPWLVRVAATIGLGKTRGHEAARIVAEPLGATETRVSDRASDPSGLRWRVEGHGDSLWISGRPRGDSGPPCALCGNAYDAHSTDDADAPPPAWWTPHGESCPGGGEDGPFWMAASDEQLDAMARAAFLRDVRAGDTGPILVLLGMLRSGAPETALILLGGERPGDATPDPGVASMGEDSDYDYVRGDLADLLGLPDDALTIEDYRDLGDPESLPLFWRQARPILERITDQAALDLADELLGLPTARRVVPGSPEWNETRARLELMRRRPRVAWFMSIREKLRDFVGLGDINPETATDAQLELPSSDSSGHSFLYLVDGDEVCSRCANRTQEPWTLTGVNSYLEGPPILCSDCHEVIEGDPSADDDEDQNEETESNGRSVNPRRNSDERLRQLERQAEATGAGSDIDAFAVERKRVGVDSNAILDELLGNRLLLASFNRENVAGKGVRHRPLRGLVSSMRRVLKDEDVFGLFHYVFGRLGLIPMVRDGIWVTVAHHSQPYSPGDDPVTEFQRRWPEMVTDDDDYEALGLAWARTPADDRVRVLGVELLGYTDLLERRLKADSMEIT